MQKFSKILVLSFVLGLLSVGCSDSNNSSSNTKFDSAHSIALEAEILSGKIISNTDKYEVIERQIREQLMYTIGQLNGIGGGVDMSKLEIVIDSVSDGEEGEYLADYTAKLFISWPRDTEIPKNYKLYLPNNGTWSGLSAFFKTYGSDEHEGKQCLAGEAHDVSQGMFWYYYRPQNDDCSVRGEFVQPEHVFAILANLKISEKNTEGKSPEYEKIWEDDRLEVTLIFGKAEHGSTSNWDAGVRGYVRTYDALVSLLGEPVESNLIDDSSPSVENYSSELIFLSGEREIDVHLYLIDDIKTVDTDFSAKYNKRTLSSDFIAYNGHAGLGANIRALARMGEFVKGHYQVFLINGCDTFAYVDDSLNVAHQEVNPDFGPDKFVDVITNAMPAFFYSMPAANIAVIEGLLNEDKSYRDILSNFDEYQKASVSGEQDNMWPKPFL
jgi:hypothetical protein